MSILLYNIAETYVSILLYDNIEKHTCQYSYILTFTKYRCEYYYYTLILKNTYVSILCINMRKYMLTLPVDEDTGRTGKGIQPIRNKSVTLATDNQRFSHD